MHKFSMMKTRTGRCGLGLTWIAALVACGGGDSAAPLPVKVATANVTIGISNATTADRTATASVLAAVATTAAPVSFATGFSGTDASGKTVTLPAEATKVAFTANAADATKPAFEISSAAGTAKGDTTLGSCTFAVKITNFKVPHPMSLVGTTLKVANCTVTLPVANQTADGSAVSKPVAVTFNDSTGTIARLVAVKPDGTISIDGVTTPVTTPIITTSAAGG